MAVTQEILEITEVIKQVVQADRIYLFGSHAYGTPGQNSDYDFFVVMPDGGVSPAEAATSVRRALARMDRLTAVDVLANYRSRFDELTRFSTLERKIERDGVLLYAAN